MSVRISLAWTLAMADKGVLFDPSGMDESMPMELKGRGIGARRLGHLQRRDFLVPPGVGRGEGAGRLFDLIYCDAGPLVRLRGTLSPRYVDSARVCSLLSPGRRAQHTSGRFVVRSAQHTYVVVF